MAFTKNRPTATLTQLNTIWTTLRDGLSPKIPPKIQVVAGQSNFSVIDIYDTPSDPLSRTVLYKKDVIFALLTRANSRKKGFFSASFHPESNSVNSFYVIDVRDGFSQATVATSLLPTGYTYSASQNIISFVENRNFNPALTIGVTTGATNFNILDSANKPALLARAKYYLSTSTLIVESYTQNSGLGTYASNIYGGVERFDSKGYDTFNYGTGKTYTSTAFVTFFGYTYWYPGPGNTLGSIETFDDINWPQGISPGGGSGSEDMVWGEDLTSQITGSTTIFITDYPYETGTLSVYWNGQRQYSGTITEVNSTTFSTSFTPTSGDVLIVDYDKSTT